MKKKFLVIGIVIVVILGMIYITGVVFFQNHFLLNMRINGVKVDGMKYETAIEELNQKLNSYEILVEGRENLKFRISGEEIGLQANWGNSIQMILEEANEFLWFTSLYEKAEIEIPYTLSMQDSLLKQVINSQQQLTRSEMRPPENAQIGNYLEDENCYELIMSDPGTFVLKNRLFQYIKESILVMKDTIDISDSDCYVKPTIDEKDERLLNTYEKMNQMVFTKIMYQFGEKCVQLDGKLIHQWIKRDGYAVLLDEEQILEYVKQLSRDYDTAYRKHKFITVDGIELIISQGHYGWWMNRKEEANALSELIRQGAVTDRKAIYYQEAASFEEPDYGDTYIEIDLTNQHLYLWIDGNIYLETDFVSGNVSAGRATPEGIFPITYKERNTTLRGADYASDVSYWMPFNGGIGLHDASWRNTFGGTIYLKNGSHGCINLPVDMAEKIYAQVYTGMPVICYYRTGDNLILNREGNDSNE